MNQDKIGKLIKDIRKKEKLTQEQFALKYGVTYQAVSKWENSKNIPDISILQQICKDYKIDLNDLLNENENINKSKRKNLVIVATIMAVVIVIVGVSLFFVKNNKKNDDFHFNKLSTTCEDFTLFGSIAYNDNKTSIYISNINYCGNEDNKEYRKIECSLYEDNGDSKTKISSFSYKENEKISLEEFLKMVDFRVEHYSNSCKMYQDDRLYLEIEAIDENNKPFFYKIPLELDDTCEEYFGD